MVLGIFPGSAAHGILARGDFITHVDGHSLLTAEGARRFASIEPGDDVRLKFRRNGRTMNATIHAAEPPANVFIATPEASGYSIGYGFPETPAVPPEAALAPEPPRASARVITPVPANPAEVAAAAVAPSIVTTTVAPAIPVAPAVPAIPSTLGWFGFSIRCNNCGWSTTEPGGRPFWEADEPPELSRVATDGPAARAGLRQGDRITHIDGLSLTTRAGGRRFGSVRPGQRVRLTVRRGTSTITRDVTLGTRPEWRAAIAATTPRPSVTPAGRRELRYTGRLDNVSVEVWSPGGPTVEKIGDTMVITVGSSVVRIKVDPDDGRRTPDARRR